MGFQDRNSLDRPPLTQGLRRALELRAAAGSFGENRGPTRVHSGGFRTAPLTRQYASFLFTPEPVERPGEELASVGVIDPAQDPGLEDLRGLRVLALLEVYAREPDPSAGIVRVGLGRELIPLRRVVENHLPQAAIAPRGSRRARSWDRARAIERCGCERPRGARHSSLAARARTTSRDPRRCVPPLRHSRSPPAGRGHWLGRASPGRARTLRRRGPTRRRTPRPARRTRAARPSHRDSPGWEELRAARVHKPRGRARPPRASC